MDRFDLTGWIKFHSMFTQATCDENTLKNLFRRTPSQKTICTNTVYFKRYKSCRTSVERFFVLQL